MMFYIERCLCLFIVLHATSFAAAQSLPPELDLDDGDMFFCDGADDDCDASASAEDINVGLLQTDIHLHREMKASVKEVRISGDADVQAHATVQMHDKDQQLPQMQISGGADVSASQQAAPVEHAPQVEEEVVQPQAAWESVTPQTILKAEVVPKYPNGSNTIVSRHGTAVLCLVAFFMVLVVSVCGIRAYYQKGARTRASMMSADQILAQGQAEAMERQKLMEAKALLPSYGTAKVKGSKPSYSLPDLSPEWTTVPTSVQPGYCPAALRSAVPEKPMQAQTIVTAAHEISKDNLLNAESKQPESFSTGARFVLPPQSLDRVGSGLWNATGMSGKDFLRVSITDVPETGHSSLVISICGDEADFKQTWKFEKSPLIGTLPIIGSQGELYGTLEPVPGGRCLVKHMGKVVMSLEIGNHMDLSATASDAAGRQIAWSIKNLQAGFSTSEGGETWKVQCKPEADAILVAGCMLAFMLLGAGAGAGTPAFSKLSK